MSCPYCGDESRQFFLGNLGSNAVVRCGMCGWQYNDDRIDEDEDDDYVVSRSEAGHFVNNGDADMLVYRDVAENAVEFFNSRPSGDYESFQFSIIKNGELAREIGMIRPDVILRCICRYVSKFDGVVTVLSYRDMAANGEDYNDLILSRVNDVRIGGGYLAISGTDRKGVSKTFRYRICDDPGAAVRPVPTPAPKPPVPKPEVKPAEKPKPTPVAKPAKKKTAAKPAKPAKNGVTYEVRVNGTIRASYSSKAKAEAEKKKLKAAGEPAKIFVVGY